MSRRQTPIAEQLRKAIRQAERNGVTRYRMAKAANMQQAQFGRIADGVNVPKLDTADRIAKAIGASLVLLPGS